MTTEERQKYLDLKLDANTTVGSAPASQFIQWCLNKVNGLNFFNADVAEITGLATGLPAKNMADDSKIALCQKLEKLGIKLFE